MNGGPAATEQAVVVDVVVDKRGRVDHLDGRGHGHGVHQILATHGQVGQHGDVRPQMLTARCQNVPAGVVQQRYFAIDRGHECFLNRYQPRVGQRKIHATILVHNFQTFLNELRWLL